MKLLIYILMLFKLKKVVSKTNDSFIVVGFIAFACWPFGVTYANQPIQVTVKPLEQIVIYPEMKVPAEVITVNDSRLSAQVTAVIQSIPVEVGQTVKKGTPLVLLEKKDLELALQSSKETLKALEASYKLAKNQLKRTETLSSKQLVSEESLGTRQTELIVRKADLDAQRITVQQLERELEKTVIRAPFKAIILEHLSHVGELAMPGTNLIHLYDAEKVLVSTKLQTKDVGSLNGADKVWFVTDSSKFPVKIHSITPALDLRERSQELRLDFSKGRALIGTTGYVKWKSKSAYLPSNVLVRRDMKLGVFIVKDGKANFVALPNAEEGQLVKTDLHKSTKVIVDGRFSLQTGQLVKIEK